MRAHVTSAGTFWQEDDEDRDERPQRSKERAERAEAIQQAFRRGYGLSRSLAS